MKLIAITKACVLAALIAVASVGLIAPPIAEAAPHRHKLRMWRLRANAIIELTNAERQKAGLAPLKVNSLLTSAAVSHAGNMARQNNMNHTLDSKGPRERLNDIGYSFSFFAENIANGYPTAEAAVTGWMNSAGHKANILNPNLTEIGVGVRQNTDGKYYYCQVFGKPR